MAQRESRLSREIMKELRLKGAFCFKVWGSEHMMAGLPDIIGCYGGRFFAFETKTPDKRSNTSIVQERILQKIKDAGGLAQVVCTTTEAVDAMMRHRINSRRSGTE